MAIATTTMKNALCTAYSNQGALLSVHTGDPGTTGANEISGGSPAYARQQTSWGTASNGQIAGLQVTFNLPAGQYTYVGLWTNNGSTFLDKIAISSTTLGAQGTLLVTPTFTTT